MTSPGVIHRDEVADRQSSHQQLIFLSQESRLTRTQQRIDLATRNIDTPFAELFAQQRLSHLAVVMLVENVAAQYRTEVLTAQRRRQLPDHALTLGRAPVFQTITSVVCADVKLLHHHVTIALEA